MIRHAEKESGTNPRLTAEGMERAKKWTAFFDDVPLDAIYSTDTERTQQTAAPIATKKGLEILFYNPRSPYTDDLKPIPTEKPC